MKLVRYLIGRYENEAFQTTISYNAALPDALKYAKAALSSGKKTVIWEELEDENGTKYKREYKEKR